jgi:hypothetical protein
LAGAAPCQKLRTAFPAGVAYHSAAASIGHSFGKGCNFPWLVFEFRHLEWRPVGVVRFFRGRCGRIGRARWWTGGE